MTKLVISLDGPSASGKGLIGSLLAKEFDLEYFQSSLVYRGLAYICISKGISFEETDKIIQVTKEFDILKEVESIDLNLEEIGDFASKISTILEVRNALTIYLKNIILKHKRIIMEGRDIGTVIAPNATLKLFINANIEVRAQRRYKQLCLEGKECMINDILNLMKKRDERDRLRKNSPLEIAKGAFVIDTSYLSPEEIIEKIKNYIVNHDNAGDLLKLFNLKAEI